MSDSESENSKKSELEKQWEAASAKLSTDQRNLLDAKKAAIRMRTSRSENSSSLQADVFDMHERASC